MLPADEKMSVNALLDALDQVDPVQVAEDSNLSVDDMLAMTILHGEARRKILSAVGDSHLGQSYLNFCGMLNERGFERAFQYSFVDDEPSDGTIQPGPKAGEFWKETLEIWHLGGMLLIFDTCWGGINHANLHFSVQVQKEEFFQQMITRAVPVDEKGQSIWRMPPRPEFQPGQWYCHNCQVDARQGLLRKIRRIRETSDVLQQWGGKVNATFLLCWKEWKDYQSRDAYAWTEMGLRMLERYESLPDHIRHIIGPFCWD